MKPATRDHNHVLTAVVAGLLLCGVAGYGWWNRTVTTQREVCRVCVAERDRKTVAVYGHLMRTWETRPEPSDMTRNYFDRYLAYPHAHEWEAEGRVAVTGGFSRTIPSPAATNPNPLAIYQLSMTRCGLQLVAASGIPSLADRRRYFDSIRQTLDANHLLRVMKTWREINDQVVFRPTADIQADEIWSPEMEGVTIPPEVKAGGLLPDGGH